MCSGVSDKGDFMPQLAKKKDCIGCTACAAACPKKCIEMYKDRDGFAYPRVVSSSDCTNCRLCEKVCPVLDLSRITEENTSAYAAFSRDDVLREKSTSGGIFSELARKILKQGGAAYGARYTENFKVAYFRAENESELSLLRGAKYAEAQLGDTFADVKRQLESGRAVLFSGTPCKVSALRSFLRRDYDRLYCVDFVCHSIPSPTAFEKYIEYRAATDAHGVMPESIEIRSKSTGWSRFSYSSVFKYGDGTIYSISGLEDPYIKLFLSGGISRPSCADCRFKGYSRASDITIGDFWGIWDIAPDMDDNGGTSVVLVHSPKGRRIWEELDGVISREVALEQSSQKNMAMLGSTPSLHNRDAVMRKIRKGDFAAAISLSGRPPSLPKRCLSRGKRIIARILKKLPGGAR